MRFLPLLWVVSTTVPSCKAAESLSPSDDDVFLEEVIANLEEWLPFEAAPYHVSSASPRPDSTSDPSDNSAESPSWDFSGLDGRSDWESSRTPTSNARSTDPTVASEKFARLCFLKSFEGGDEATQTKSSQDDAGLIGDDSASSSGGAHADWDSPATSTSNSKAGQKISADASDSGGLQAVEMPQGPSTQCYPQFAPLTDPHTLGECCLGTPMPTESSAAEAGDSDTGAGVRDFCSPPPQKIAPVKPPRRNRFRGRRTWTKLGARTPETDDYPASHDEPYPALASGAAAAQEQNSDVSFDYAPSETDSPGEFSATGRGAAIVGNSDSGVRLVDASTQTDFSETRDSTDAEGKVTAGERVILFRKPRMFRRVVLNS